MEIPCCHLWKGTSNNSTIVRAAGEARLFFLIKPIISLFSDVVRAVCRRSCLNCILLGLLRVSHTTTPTSSRFNVLERSFDCLAFEIIILNKFCAFATELRTEKDS